MGESLPFILIERKLFMKKKKYKLRLKNIGYILLFLVLLTIFVFCFIRLICWTKDNKVSNEILEDVNGLVEVKEETTDEAKKEEDETKIDVSDPYWDFINTSFLSIDYSKLREKNKDIIGWVKVNSTNINYPVVQYSDNEYYLTHDLYKNYNGGGWVFLDYRNKNDFNNKNSIIYAHGRENKTMFGTLKNILNKEWYQNKDNYVIKTSSLSGSYVWQVFSVYKIPNTNDYIKTNFSTDSEYQTFLNLITKRSIYDFKTNVTINNKILTLSTCFDDNSKVVLHAKLIKSY